MKTKKLIAALLLSTATVTLGPVACNMVGSEAAVQGTELGIDAASMDRAVKPGNDFYKFANGAWMEATEIPSDRSSVGGFLISHLETEKNLEALVAEIVGSDVDAGSDAERVKSYYEAYMDTDAIEAAGMQPVAADLQAIAAITDKSALAKAIGENARADVDPLNATNFSTRNLFGIFVSQALAETEVMPYILQGGLGMPDRDYYVSGESKMAAHQAAYKKYIADLLTAGGIDDAVAKAERIYDLELKIAQAHATIDESYDWNTGTAIWTADEFASKAPGFDWGAFFNAASLGDQVKFNAYHAGPIANLAGLVETQPLESWKDWMTFHLINGNSSVLPKEIDELSFAFNGTQLYGVPEQQSRDKRAIAALNNDLGDALGKLYVEKHFPASSKATVEAMVDNIKVAFAKRVEAIEWMAPETKEEAVTKVETMGVGVGYPDSWVDYSEYTADAANPYANRKAAGLLRYKNQLAKIGKPQDKREWWMNAQLVNAVNLPVQNAMNFPAAILQRPFFDAAADPAYNYGAIGAVIGHEISHSFDDNGAAFDSTGAMRNWWTDADMAKFKAEGKRLADQYSQYKPFDDLSVNGELTLGENIADVAGLSAAYDAYRASLGGEEAPVIDGFTGDQRFFIAYAQAWATKMREAALRSRIATDGHAPGNYRALTVRNLDAWYDAFDVKEGDELYLAPEDRVRIW